MSSASLFVLVLAAVVCGWLLAAWQYRGKNLFRWGGREQGQTKTLARETYELPYYFSTDIPDYAIEAFIEAVDVNSDTLETHLALGAIHRRQGELDRAIRIHENLVRRDGLTGNQVSLAKFELALDYVKAGLLDRAEEFLQDLLETSTTHRKPALHLLIDLYQDEKEWLKASNAANELHPCLDQEQQEILLRRRSHFYCEQAEVAISKKDYLGARRAITQAKSSNPAGNRPAILMAFLQSQLNHPKKALEILEKLILDSEEILEDTLRLLEVICAQMDKPGCYYSLLERAYKRNPGGRALSILTRELTARGEQERLLAILEEMPPTDIGNIPMRLFSDLGDRLISRLGRSWLKSLKNNAPMEEQYQCQHCGFETREHYWQCAGCRRWETLRIRSQLNA